LHNFNTRLFQELSKVQTFWFVNLKGISHVGELHWNVSCRDMCECRQ